MNNIGDKIRERILDHPTLWAVATLLFLFCLYQLTIFESWEACPVATNKCEIEEEDYNNCNVAKINLKGYIDVYDYEDGDISSEAIAWEIERANKTNGIKAIILDIDSGGGSPVGGEEIANALSRAYNPTVALIRDMGISAAYQAAVGADIIFASVYSDIGSIGITSSYLEYSKMNQEKGITYNKLSSGKFKDMFSSEKPLTYEERLLIERDLEILHNNFVEFVAERRELDLDKVRALADGSSMVGQMALDNGLIDQIGNLYDVRQYLEDLIGEEVVLCEEY